MTTPTTVLRRSAVTARLLNEAEGLPLVTFWAFLAQVLERGSSRRDALQRMRAWWQAHFPGQGSPSADTNAYCQARGRLEKRLDNAERLPAVRKAIGEISSRRLITLILGEEFLQ